MKSVIVCLPLLLPTAVIAGEEKKEPVVPARVVITGKGTTFVHFSSPGFRKPGRLT